MLLELERERSTSTSCYDETRRSYRSPLVELDPNHLLLPILSLSPSIPSFVLTVPQRPGDQQSSRSSSSLPEKDYILEAHGLVKVLCREEDGEDGADEGERGLDVGEEIEVQRRSATKTKEAVSLSKKGRGRRGAYRGVVRLKGRILGREGNKEGVGREEGTKVGRRVELRFRSRFATVIDEIARFRKLHGREVV